MDFMDVIEIPRIDNVKLTRLVYSEIDGVYDQLVNHTIDGSICLTSHQLIFSPKQKSTSSQVDEEIWLTHTLIDSLEQKIRETRFQLLIRTKDFQIFLIDFSSLHFCQSVAKSLEKLSNLSSDSLKLPFFVTGKYPAEKSDWQIYSIEEEFACIASLQPPADCKWRISDVNKSYSVCGSYPSRIIVPKTIDDQTIIKSAQFRAWGRFPVLSYFHPSTKSFLLRCSQPMLGTNNRRCKEDETLLKSCLPLGKKGCIYDLRDANVLKSAASKGGGYETDANYPLWKRVNRHLDRYDQLHTSFSKLVEACLGDSGQYLSKLDSSNWIQNARQVVHTACCIADELNNKDSCVLVHGWDGLDNTLVVSSLVHVILNPEFRTIKGFEKLIEKEWLQAGHPFSKRCAKLAFGSTNHRLEGPVFLLFLDCIRQFLEQFCLSFEFNEEFLICLLDNTYSSDFGTFLCNSQSEREKLEIESRTASLWTHVNSVESLKTYRNPLYEPNETILWPSLHTQSWSVWTSLILRHQRKHNPIKEAKSEIWKKVEANELARQRVEKLRNEFIELQKEAINQGLIQLER